MTQPRVPAEVTAAALMLADAVLSAAWGVLNGARMGHPSGDLLAGYAAIILLWRPASSDFFLAGRA